MPLPQPWQVTPAADTLPEYTDYLSSLLRPSHSSPAASRRRRRITSAEVTGQCSVCLDLFGVSVSLVDKHIVAHALPPRLRMRRRRPVSPPPPLSPREGEGEEKESTPTDFALYHTHPHSQHNLADGEVKLYGSKDILYDTLAAGDHPR